MIKLLMFDIGGVLIDFTETQYIHYLHKEVLPDVPERRLEKFIMPLITLMEYGTLSVTELEHMVGKHFDIEGLDLHWVDGFLKLSKPRKNVIALLDRLADDYDAVLLSNVSYSRFDELEERYLKMMKVKSIYTSCSLKMRKPQPGIYEYVLSKNKVKPKEALFVDNQIENVIGAEKVGITSVWFRDYKKLVEDLRDKGVKL
jgi:HAD superfamily hydrolase (TIGR01509 family)